jgi:hypothetical protein
MHVINASKNAKVAKIAVRKWPIVRIRHALQKSVKIVFLIVVNALMHVMNVLNNAEKRLAKQAIKQKLECLKIVLKSAKIVSRHVRIV